MLPWLSRLSVSKGPVARFRHRRSFRYQRISPLHRKFHMPLPPSRSVVSGAVLSLSERISPQTDRPAYAPFKPSDTEQRSPLTYYRRCWHVISGGFLSSLTQHTGLFTQYDLLTCDSGLQPKGPSSRTRRRSVRLSSIAEYSELQPPVGVRPVSQCRCARSASQPGYPSKPWWAVTPPTSW